MAGGYSRAAKAARRTALRDMVASQPVPASNALPLTHITDCIRLPDILRAKNLEPRHCDVFGDDRIYAFYARPAFRGSKAGPLRNLNFAPVGFIVSPLVANNCALDEVIPLDTGAMKKGLLADEVHPDLGPYDFALEPSVDSARRIAALFFGSEKNYFHGKLDRSIARPSFQATDSEIVSYESLIQVGANLSRDERATSIELHFKQKVALDGNVLAIILPQDFLDIPAINAAIRSGGIVPLAYEFFPDHTVKECAGVFYRVASEFYSNYKAKFGWNW